MGLISSIIGAVSNWRTNKANLEATKDTNEMNWKINQANLDQAREFFNTSLANSWDMWRATNEYNDPKNQKSRMLGAGLNPYMSQIGTGTAQQGSSPQGSTPSMIPMQAPRMNPYQPSFDLNSIADSITNVLSKKEEIKGQRIDNEYRAAKNRLDLAKQYTDMLNVSADTKGKIIQNAYDGESLNARIERAKQEPEYMRLQMHFEVPSRPRVALVRRQEDPRCQKNVPILIFTPCCQLQRANW